MVAPYAGAWIETLRELAKVLLSLVAPYAGAWIETSGKRILVKCGSVAPYAGAWIETLSGARITMSSGRTLCGCVD